MLKSEDMVECESMVLKLKSSQMFTEECFSTKDDAIGSNCPGISGTVPDLLTLSLVPEGLPICPGRSLISS